MTISPWKHDFPIFSVNAHPNLCYFDSASVSLNPKHVADAIYHYQCFFIANNVKQYDAWHQSDDKVYRQGQEKVKHFINATDNAQLTFSTGNNASLVFVVQQLQASHLKDKNNLVVDSEIYREHLSLWQQIAKVYDLSLRVIPLGVNGVVEINEFEARVDSETLLAVVNMTSSYTGLDNDVVALTSVTHDYGAQLLVDCSQAVCMKYIDFSQLACDFLIFSANTMYGVDGCGVLIINSQQSLLQPNNIPNDIVDEKSVPAPALAYNNASIVGLVEAIDYLNDVTKSEHSAYIDCLAGYLFQQMQALPFIKPVVSWEKFELYDERGCVKQLPAILCFSVDNIDSDDVAALLSDSDVIAKVIAWPCAPQDTKLINKYIRVSLGLYNSFEDIDRLIQALEQVHHSVILTQWDNISQDVS